MSAPLAQRRGGADENDATQREPEADVDGHSHADDASGEQSSGDQDAARVGPIEQKEGVCDLGR